MRPARKPVVFLGPSLPVEEARRLCSAVYRPPVRRGDLDAFGAGDVVAIVDGVFDQNLAISPREIQRALERGVTVLGSSSMGALRAAEVRGVEGIGKVFQMYAGGVIEDDDEVALAFDPDSLRAISDPMVNIRHSVEQLRRPGTIDAKTAQRILHAAKKRHYRERTFKQALRDSGLAQRADSPLLLQMLQRFDLKRDDAVTLLESLATRRMARVRRAPARREAPAPAARSTPRSAGIYLWEYGESVPFETLLAFTKVMGTFPEYARSAAARLLLSGGKLKSTRTPDVAAADLNRRLVDLRVQWSWLSAEELQVTLAHLGSTPETLLRDVASEEQASLRVAALARSDEELLKEVLRAELILNDLALKREAIRAGTIGLWAERASSGGGPDATPEEVGAAKALICERLNVLDWERAVKVLVQWSLAPEEAEGWATRLALARRWGIEVRRAMAGKSPVRVRSLSAGPNPLRLRPRRKRPGDRRFATPPAVGAGALPKLCAAVGVTRVGVVTGLDRTGIPIAHAFRPDGQFSSTIGSGKAFTPQGAKIGAVMEETEKWCQERYPPPAMAAVQLSGTYDAVAARHPAISPRLLNLPHDSRYTPQTSLRWIPCWDLVAGRKVYAPTAAFCFDRLDNDPFYSAWLAEKVFDTNGLASAFTIEEALIHAICEVIERHSVKVAVVSSENPGGPRQRMRVVNPLSAPESSRSLIRKLIRGGARVRIADVTSEVRVPAFLVRVKRERVPVYEFFEADRDLFEGSACHPDPEVALNMALLEAAQIVMTTIAGGREDLTLHEHSLGRHERTEAFTFRARFNGFGVGAEEIEFGDVSGLNSRDCLEDLQWLVERLGRAGIRHVLVADCSLPEVAPARVVRVIIPGLEPQHPVYTGDRARAALLDDLLVSTPEVD